MKTTGLGFSLWKKFLGSLVFSSLKTVRLKQCLSVVISQQLKVKNSVFLFQELLGFPDSSVGKESACVAGDPGSVLESGRSAGEGQATHSCIPGFPCGSAGKESACSAGNWGWTPGLGRSPGEGKGYALQYSGLENSIQPMGLKRLGHD